MWITEVRGEPCKGSAPPRNLFWGTFRRSPVALDTHLGLLQLHSPRDLSNCSLYATEERNYFILYRTEEGITLITRKRIRRHPKFADDTFPSWHAKKPLQWFLYHMWRSLSGFLLVTFCTDASYFKFLWDMYLRSDWHYRYDTHALFGYVVLYIE